MSDASAARKSGLGGAISRIAATLRERREEAGEAPPWIKQVAVLTGVLAAISGYLTVRSTMLTSDAIYMSGEAILAQTQSSDAWAEYQADSVKARIVETAILAQPNAQNLGALVKEGKELRARQPALRKTAIGKEAQRDEFLSGGRKLLAERDLLSYAGFAAQIGIVLASVAALVRSRTAFYTGVGVGVAGVLVMIYAWAVHLQLAQ